MSHPSHWPGLVEHDGPSVANASQRSRIDLHIVWYGAARRRRRAFVELSRRPVRRVLASNTFLVTGVEAGRALRWLVRHLAWAQPLGPAWIRVWLSEWLIQRAREIASAQAGGAP